jgi:hypothetical protein
MYETDPFSPLRIQSDQPKLPLENLFCAGGVYAWTASPTTFPRRG